MIKAKAEALSLIEAEALRLEEEEKKEALQRSGEMNFQMLDQGCSNALDQDQVRLKLHGKELLAEGGTEMPKWALQPQPLPHQQWKSWKAPHGNIVVFDENEAKEMASKLLSSFDEFEGQKLSFMQFRE